MKKEPVLLRPKSQWFPTPNAARNAPTALETRCPAQKLKNPTLQHSDIRYSDTPTVSGLDEKQLLQGFVVGMHTETRIY
jgi:hypothetical protein